MDKIIYERDIKDKTELYSFDIFDTLVTRKVATPKGIFALMQQKLEENPDFTKEFKNDFYNIRTNSEKYAREYFKSKNGTTEVTFDDIYAQIQKNYYLSEASIIFLKDLEIATEIENMVGIEENISKVKNLIKNNKRVILISDMYLSSNTLHKILSEVDNIFDELPIYVSSEYKASKNEGALYKIVQKKENVSFRHWKHFGDHVISDFKKAKQLGINSRLYNFSPLMPYEMELLKAHFDNVDIQYMVGTAKLTRLNIQAENQDKYDFGASYSAPLLYSYVTEVIETALSKGFKNLYFIARDGYIPKLIADIIIREKNLPIKARYIYGSRLAWRLPDEENYENFIQMNLTEYKYMLSLEFLAYRFGIPVDTLSERLSIKSKKAVLNSKQIMEIKSSLLYDSSLKSLILNSYKERRELLIDYLKQEIDFSESSFAFVEINGSGKTQLFLSNYLNKIAPCSILTFYITVSADNVKGVIQQHVFCAKPRAYNPALELICRTMYGQTVGYKREENSVVPILDEFNASALLDWGYNEYLQGIIDYVNNILKYDKNLFNKHLFYAYFDYISGRCDNKTASILGDIPFKLVGKENKVIKAAQKLSFFDFALHLVFKKHILSITQYPQLSYARGHFLTNFVKTIMEWCEGSFDYWIELKFIYMLRKLKNQKIALWGASIFLEGFIKRWHISSENIVAIIDKNPNRIGQKIGPYPILPPNELYKLKPDCIMMTIKNKHKMNYESISYAIRSSYNFARLVQNIFDNSLFSLMCGKDDKKYCTQAELNEKLYKMENKLNRLVQNNLSTAALHQKTFLPFKNKHSNQEIVIVATGPTANLYNPIKDAIHIGVNRAFQIGNGRIPLDYVFIQDYSGSTKEYIDELDNYRPDKCQKFYGLTTEWIYEPERTIPESHAIKANALRYRTDWANIYEFEPGFAYDISTQPMGCFGSITFPALQFALWTNPKRIYLVGCDCSLAGYAYNSNEKNSLITEDIISAYIKFKDFAAKYYPDTEIISINPMGLKGIFKDKYETYNEAKEKDEVLV